jgi:hypothetical protein
MKIIRKFIDYIQRGMYFDITKHHVKPRNLIEQRYHEIFN